MIAHRAFFPLDQQAIAASRVKLIYHVQLSTGPFDLTGAI